MKVRCLSDRRKLTRLDGQAKHMTNGTVVRTPVEIGFVREDQDGKVTTLRVRAGGSGRILYPARNNGMEHMAKRCFGRIADIVMVEWEIEG